MLKEVDRPQFYSTAKITVTQHTDTHACLQIRTHVRALPHTYAYTVIFPAL